MNEREIIAYLRQCQSHAEMAWEKSNSQIYLGMAEAYRQAADYIELTVNERHAANIEALDKKQIKG